MMDKTPKAKKSMKFTSNNPKAIYNLKKISPNRSNDSPPVFEGSPVLSQDICNIDVVWDWNSPRSKSNVKKIKRPPHDLEQEKVPLRKKKSNQTCTFNKLKEKLEELKEEIQNENNKIESCSTHNNNSHEFDELKDLFNDSSIEEQLILCSQIVEQEELIKPLINDISQHKIDIENILKVNTIEHVEKKPTKVESCKSKNKFIMYKPKVKAQAVPSPPINVYFHNKQIISPRSNAKYDNYLEDNSLEKALAAFEEEEEEDSLNFNNNNGNDFPKSKQKQRLERSKCLETGLKLVVSKGPQFRKTSSFDDSCLKLGAVKKIEPLSKEILEEIERKRQEALAKRDSKKKRIGLSTPIEEISPIKCSPEEIEQKRQQAIAKLEAKKIQQEAIERNRLEAFKKLEVKKKKNKGNVPLHSVQQSLQNKITKSSKS